MSTPPAVSVAAGTTGRRGHLAEIDVLRVLTFAAVIGVHTVSFTADPHDVGAYGLLALLHFTRLVFFALTAFVLVLSALRAPRPLAVFWPRRFLLVGIPYLTWSFVYVLSFWITSDTRRGDVPDLVHALAVGVVTGTARYHLYFLLVTMQLYLVVPGLVWLVRRTTGRHGVVLAVAFVLQLGVFALTKYEPSTLAWDHGYTQSLFPTYVFFVVGGGIAAAHVDAVLAFVRERRGVVGLLVIGGAVVVLGVYGVQLALGQSPASAATVLQPSEVVWSSVVAIALLGIGAAWADRRRPAARLARAVDIASDRSFGIFLSHPLVLWALLLGGWWTAAIPRPILTPLTYVVVVGGAVGLTEVLRRTPMSLAFTGRPRRRR